MKKLMLGTNGDPDLLVTVPENYNPPHFDFYVINGGWEGTCYNGHITVHHPY